MTKEINLYDKVDNGDGTQNFIGSLAIYEDDGQLHIGIRARMTFPISMTDQEIIDYLIENDFKIYKDY